MIRLWRKRPNGERVHPGKRWAKLSRDGKVKAIADGPTHVVSSQLYGHDDVRAALEELTYYKCAYCETPIAQFDWDVEHYRPKGAVQGAVNHPGYYWLAYDWDNLLPACTYCNQSRREKPIYRVAAVMPAGGKMNQFPLSDETKRAMSPADALSREAPLLINPAKENPEPHFGYLPDGTVFATTGSVKAPVTITILRLNLYRLRRARLEALKDFITVLEMRENAKKQGKHAAVIELEPIVERLHADTKLYAGIKRYFARNPTAYGFA